MLAIATPSLFVTRFFVVEVDSIRIRVVDERVVAVQCVQVGIAVRGYFRWVVIQLGKALYIIIITFN